MGKFKKGLFFGGLLGAGAMWLSVTKEGKKMRDEMLDHAAVVYAELKEKILSSSTWQELKQQDFVAMVREMVERYASKNGLAEETKQFIEKVVGTQWKDIQKELKKKTLKK